jgi:hypothetical protein
VRQSKGDKSLIIKHNGAGLTYEVVIDLVYDRVLWVYGPEPASTHDITMFRGGLKLTQACATIKQIGIAVLFIFAFHKERS